MTKTEILTDLASKADVLDVGELTTIGGSTGPGGVMKYEAPIYRLIQPDLVQAAVQPIIVFNEGEVDEAAYYNIKKNFSDIRDTFYTSTQIKNYMDNNAPFDTAFNVLNVDVRVETEETDLARIKMEVLDETDPDAGKTVVRNLNIWKNDLDQPEYRWVG